MGRIVSPVKLGNAANGDGAAENVNGADDQRDADALATSRWGLRFARPDAEPIERTIERERDDRV